MWRTLVWLLMILASPVFLWVAVRLVVRLEHPFMFSAMFTGAVACPFFGGRGLIKDYSAGRLGRGSVAASILVILVAGVAMSLLIVVLLILSGGIR